LAATRPLPSRHRDDAALTYLIYRGFLTVEQAYQAFLRALAKSGQLQNQVPRNTG
jgi:hypothetical protein